jgi:hypothetical protein
MRTTVVWTTAVAENRAMLSYLMNNNLRHSSFSSEGLCLLMSPSDTRQRKPKQGTPPFASRTWALMFPMSSTLDKKSSSFSFLAPALCHSRKLPQVTDSLQSHEQLYCRHTK